MGGTDLGYPIYNSVTNEMFLAFGDTFSDPFGSDKKLFHTGTDFSALEGTPIYPMQDGYVFSLDFTEYGGNTVILQHNLTYDYINFVNMCHIVCYFVCKFFISL